jgi:hypothetical protein
MPCGNTAAADAYQEYCLNEKQENIAENLHELITSFKMQLKLQDADIFWEALGPDGLNCKDAEEERLFVKKLTQMFLAGDDKSLLQAASLLRQQICEYATKLVTDEAWDEACMAASEF